MNTENFTLNVSLTIPAEPCTMEGRPRDYHAMNELRGIFWAAYCARANYREGSGSEIALAAHRSFAQIPVSSPENLTYRPLKPDETIQIGDLYLSDPRYLDGRGPQFVVNYDSPSLGETVASTLLMGKFYRRTLH